MPDTGAPWNIPYVAGTDLVADWPTDSQTLAEAIADGLDAAGGIKQVVTANLSSTFSTSSTSFTDVTGLSVSITPSSASSRILVLADVQGNNESGVSTMTRLMRDSTAIAIGDSASSRIRSTGGVDGDNTSPGDVFFLGGIIVDSPATTSATTYKVQIRASANNACVNRSRYDADNDTNPRTHSSITVLEVTV